MVPDRLLRIPRRSIVEVSKVDSHLGKRIGRPLLRVAWTTEDGNEDAVAIWVRDPNRWLAELNL